MCTFELKIVFAFFFDNDNHDTQLSAIIEYSSEDNNIIITILSDHVEGGKKGGGGGGFLRKLKKIYTNIVPKSVQNRLKLETSSQDENVQL